MRCLRNIAVLGLALLPLFGAVRANAAFGGVSNLAISGGFTPGYTTDGTNGTLRWNPGTTQHEVFVNGVWTNLSRGASSGSGSGFPLTNNADFGGHGATNLSFIGPEETPDTEAFLMHDGTSYVHRYAAKSVTNILDLAAAIASTNKPHLYPMQLLKYTDGNVYYLAQEIDPAVLGTNSYPLPGTHPAHWIVFVEKGAVGSTGPSGSDGSDGADGFGYGWITPAWSSSRGYDSNTLVSYNGRAYLSLVPNTNINPTTTNTWLLYVDKGDDGTIVGTNYLLRGAWDAGELYATNDIVSYGGNLMIIGITNISVAGVAPALNADGVGTNSGNWSLHVARGMRGLTGAAGADGVYTSFTNVTQVTVTYSNAVFLNNPTTSNDVAKWQYATGDTNYFLWGPVSTAAGTLSNAASTSAWLTASVSGATVVVGATNTPIFAESDPVALAQGFQTGAQVTSAIQSAVSGSSSATNAVGQMSVNSTNYSGVNYLRLRGSSLLDFSSGPTVDVVFLADVVRTQAVEFTESVVFSNRFSADQRGQLGGSIRFNDPAYGYLLSGATYTTRPAIVQVMNMVTQGVEAVIREVRNGAGGAGSATTSISNAAPWLIESYDEIANGSRRLLISPSRIQDGTSNTAREHPNHVANLEGIGISFLEDTGDAAIHLDYYADGGTAASGMLWLMDGASGGYASFNIGERDVNLFFNGDNTAQHIFEIEGDTTPRIIWNGNGGSAPVTINESTTNSTAASGVDWFYYGRTGVIISAISATRAVTVGGTLDAREGFLAAGIAGISSTTSVLVADGGGGFATQTWIHIYGIRTQ